MVNADMCKHDWPGSGCPDCRRDLIKPGSVWTYKDVEYVVGALKENLRTQDPTGLWHPTVLYSTALAPGLVFARSVRDWLFKFEFVRSA